MEKDGPRLSPIYYIPHYKVLFFCTKSGKYYDRIDYIYTPYMLNIVCFFCFLLFDLLLLPDYFYVPLLKHYSAPTRMTSNAAKIKISILSRRKERSPEAVLEDEKC